MRAAIIVFALIIGSALCFDKPDHHDDEHHGHGRKPYNRDLSDHEHHPDDDGHDVKYDHEAFLGKEESEKFDQLSPEESKERLAVLVDKIDADSDGKVTQPELRHWIHQVGASRMANDTERHFKELDPENGKLQWDKFEERYYLKPEDRKAEDKAETEAKVQKDKRKWKLADKDGDGQLSQQEYMYFLHPEEAPHMRDFVIDDTLEELDTNKDGFISVEEFLHSYWKPSEEEPKEPEWLKQERESFASFDKNKDGRLDRKEIGDWTVPQDYDHSESESKHLIQEADANKDGVLTKEEILNKHDLFAGSQATDYGSAMKHEEL